MSIATKSSIAATGAPREPVCCFVYVAFVDNDNVQFFLRHGLTAILRAPDVLAVMVLVDTGNAPLSIRNLPPASDSFLLRHQPAQARKATRPHQYSATCDHFLLALLELCKQTPIDRLNAYLMVDSTVRGPFFPVWLPTEMRDRWWTLFTDRLSSKIALVAPVAQVSEDGRFYLPLSMLAMSVMGLTTMRQALAAAAPISPADEKSDSLAAAADRENKQPFAMRLANAVHQQPGLSFACLLQAFASADFRSLSGKRSQPPGPVGERMAIDRVETPGGYFGLTVHPYEVLFCEMDCHEDSHAELEPQLHSTWQDGTAWVTSPEFQLRATYGAEVADSADGAAVMDVSALVWRHLVAKPELVFTLEASRDLNLLFGADPCPHVAKLLTVWFGERRLATLPECRSTVCTILLRHPASPQPV